MKMDFSGKAFFNGLLGGVVIIAAVSSWIWQAGPGVLAERADRLASQTILVEHIQEKPPEPAGELFGPYLLQPEAPNNMAQAEPAPSPVASETPAAITMPGIPKDAPRLASGLVIAPFEGLYEDKPEGRLPIADQARKITPFSVYRRPYVNEARKPVISIAVMDVGLSDSSSQAIFEALPPDVSVIVSPYASAPDFWVTEARNKGHEVWLSLPMETANYPGYDPGPHTLMIGAPERENQTKLQWIMARATGYVGLVPNYQPLFMQSANDFRPVLGNIFLRGLGFADAARIPGSAPESIAVGMNAPYTSIDVWVDRPDNSAEGIRNSLQRLEDISKEGGYAAGIIQATPSTYALVQEWLKTLEQRGFLLAPLSAQTGF